MKQHFAPSADPQNRDRAIDTMLKLEPEFPYMAASTGPQALALSRRLPPPPNVSAPSRVVDLGGPYVSERGGGDDLLDGAVCGVVDEAGYDQGIWQTWCPAEPCDVVSHALGRVGYRHGLGDLG